MKRNNKYSFAVFIFIFMQVIGFFCQKYYFLEQESEISSSSYSNGYDDALKKSGLNALIEDAERRGYNNARLSIENSGYDAGYQDGYDAGHDDFVLELGENDGYDLGYDNGYSDGYDDGRENVSAMNWISRIIDLLIAVLLPGIICVGILYIICECIIEFVLGRCLLIHKSKSPTSDSEALGSINKKIPLWGYCCIILIIIILLFPLYDQFNNYRHSETADSQQELYRTSDSVYAWVPSNGKHYHSVSTCSGMKSPIKISIEEAKRKGYTACQKCY